MQAYCPFSALEPYPALTGTQFTFTTFRAPQIVILNPFATEHADSVKIVKEPSELWPCLQFSTPITEVSAFMGPISDRRFIAIRSPVGTNHVVFAEATAALVLDYAGSHRDLLQKHEKHIDVAELMNLALKLEEIRSELKLELALQGGLAAIRDLRNNGT
ncbi:uncharacterized protein CTHT_0002790 [Thermochaetoides thermophila DSM 1495]|uniref:Uncharacterized protein n=1 Tax=Chaetomium thermophilum (strain DSM 1495 / CBS 144.50 / IMI 039719) TaxID=759272 RepID=G0RZF6_CHATD|nr:hypothetical protein CTHT_0002790 [Thermochaetoides thermophila DSM 1495]EGS23584.1 hypothetical protein CTHT_0002790 [Thermochaetoides thermophila DSM 1495]